jgi:toxin ParE1/3/4
MACKVWLSSDSADDLNELYAWLSRHDSPQKAGHVPGKIEKALTSLSQHPDRGAYPNELLEPGIREYREIFFKTYRIIYRVIGKNVMCC